MGVPAFYRWLSEKYPKICSDVVEDRVYLANNSNSIRLPFDCTRPNPSDLECDNFYIDMNGIIHPCSHPEVGPQPKTEEEMYENVCRYVDRLFRTVRPRKLLYLAIDGVAPRAKMNQQRSRRFRAAQEAREKKEIENELKDTLVKAGHQFIDAGKKDAWDSNVITPGTKFMLNLSEYIRFYIRKRISTDKAWKDITVIFSDASVPGEGEHKIMAHVRLQRTQPDYNPNLVHILHGLDADLIMLALATHEAHFYILREEVLFGRRGAEEAERRREQSGFRDKQRALDEGAGAEAMDLLENKTKPLQRISIPILREYLAFEFQQCNHVPFPEVSFERLIDDIVFLCFFVGNDFLPHLPSLDIRDGALDFLFNVYKRVLPTLGDYITNHGGEVNLSHVDVILSEVGSIEDYVFSLKHKNEANDKRRREQFKQRKKHLTKNGQAPKANHPGGDILGGPKIRGRAARILEGKNNAVTLGKDSNSGDNSKSVQENARAAEELKSSLKASAGASPEKRKAKEISSDAEEEKSSDANKSDTAAEDDTKPTPEETDAPLPDAESLEASQKLLKETIKQKEQSKLDDFAKNVVDKVRLHESGWKNRYYSDKCKADDVEENGGREHLFRSYVTGLCWVMKYYYEGCPSWQWFYPFHYAPFASDLRNIERFEKDCKSFDLGTPFKPVEQLMAVFPSDSSHAIPKSIRWYMSDPESPIIDFYPREIVCDPNGKAMPWLWVVLLPFIDEERLLAAVRPGESKWSDYEQLCNARGLDDGYVFCHISHQLASSLTPVIDSKNKNEKLMIEDAGIFGQLRLPLSNEVYPLDKKSVVHPPATSNRIHTNDLEQLLTSPIDPNAALCCAFTEPKKEIHMSTLLKDATPPEPALRQDDFRIRRPRLNRGGGTIASMGTGRKGESDQNGFGSMNISNYERNLAAANGRGNQMNQTGTRAWGAMEPNAKRQRHDNRNYNQQGGGYQQQRQQHQHQQYTPFQQPYQGNHNNNAGHHGRSNSTHPNNRGGNRWQPPNSQNSRHQPYQQSQPRWQPPPNQPRQPPRQGYNFQQFAGNNNVPHNQGQDHRSQSQPRNGNAQGGSTGASGVSANVMSNLRSQLASTLKKNRDRKR